MEADAPKCAVWLLVTKHDIDRTYRLPGLRSNMRLLKTRNLLWAAAVLKQHGLRTGSIAKVRVWRRPGLFGGGLACREVHWVGTLGCPGGLILVLGLSWDLKSPSALVLQIARIIVGASTASNTMVPNS